MKQSGTSEPVKSLDLQARSTDEPVPFYQSLCAMQAISGSAGGLGYCQAFVAGSRMEPAFL